MYGRGPGALDGLVGGLDEPQPMVGGEVCLGMISKVLFWNVGSGLYKTERCECVGRDSWDEFHSRAGNMKPCLYIYTTAIICRSTYSADQTHVTAPLATYRNSGKIALARMGRRILVSVRQCYYPLGLNRARCVGGWLGSSITTSKQISLCRLLDFLGIATYGY